MELFWMSNCNHSPITFSDHNYNLQSIYKSFKFDSLEYPTAEHLYQSLKATNDFDKEKVRTAYSAKMARKIGNNIVKRADWHLVKLEAMRLTVFLKLHQHPELLRNLIMTDKDEILFFDLNHYWGCCEYSGIGENNFGKILMQIRADIKLSFRLFKGLK